MDFCEPKRNYTKRLADDILNQVKHSNIKSVAERTGVSESEIETMLKDLKKSLVGQKPQDLKRLGIDEISLIKGQGNYCAVLVDLDNSQLLALVPDRTQEAIEKVLLSWGIDVLSGIEEVSIDLWRPYKTLVEKLMPHAEVVADRFHVMNQVQEELDNGRKQTKKEVNNMDDKKKKTAKLKVLHHSKYVLLANSDDLNEAQKSQLEEVNKEFPKLQKMHELKENFRKVFEESINWFDGLLNLAEWLKQSAELFPKSQGTIRRWLVEITADFEQKTTNGIVEGINQKIKLVKRCGFCFRNIENFELRCLLAFQN
ncbi:MAG: ISL3 family transposase [Hormoscilla sp. GUM202]|nr:ISL3 family transposase [Hormoscilla sp. GUM202]